MSNQTIHRDNNTKNIEAINKFFSVRKSISTVQKKARESFATENISYYIFPKKQSKIKLIDAITAFRNVNDSITHFKSRYPINLYYSNVIASLSYSCITSFEEKSDRDHRSTSESKIKEYFESKPSIRAKRRKEYVTYIQSVKDVFKILEFGNTKGIIDAYDGAVDILAECDENIIVEAFNEAQKKYISKQNIDISRLSEGVPRDTPSDISFRAWEKNWEILIKGITYSLKLESHQKISLILSICNFRDKLSRLIKLTIIDAIIDIYIDDTDLAKAMLQMFISKNESDDSVRDYAKEQYEECL